MFWRSFVTADGGSVHVNLEQIAIWKIYDPRDDDLYVKFVLQSGEKSTWILSVAKKGDPEREARRKAAEAALTDLEREKKNVKLDKI